MICGAGAAERGADGRLGDGPSPSLRLPPAFDSAIALAEYLHSEPTMEQAFESCRARMEVLRLQSAARNSLEWFEQCERYLDMDPVQFNYSLLTRSQRISHENLRLRDPDWLRQAEDWFQAKAGGTPGRAPMFAPFRLRDMELVNRVVVSPMAQYRAVDGCRRTGTSPTTPSGQGWRRSALHGDDVRVAGGGSRPAAPACRPEHGPSARLVRFVHAETAAKVCCQIGYSGRKGTQVGWRTPTGLARRQLGGHVGLRCAPVPGQPGAAGDDGRTWAG